MHHKPIKVLLVEDNPGDARLLRGTLAEIASPPFDLTHVERLSEAQQRLHEEPFDVVLLDLALADSSRLESLIRIHSQVPKAPIVVLTGLNDETVADWAVQEGAQDYLVKGQVDARSLVRSIRHAIERHNLGDCKPILQSALNKGGTSR